MKEWQKHFEKQFGGTREYRKERKEERTIFEGEISVSDLKSVLKELKKKHQVKTRYQMRHGCMEEIIT